MSATASQREILVQVSSIQIRARKEISNVVEALRAEGVRLFGDAEKALPSGPVIGPMCEVHVHTTAVDNLWFSEVLSRVKSSTPVSTAHLPGILRTHKSILFENDVAVFVLCGQTVLEIHKDGEGGEGFEMNGRPMIDVQMRTGDCILSL